VALDEVRVVARGGSEDEHPAGPGVERDRGAALARELLHRDFLSARAESRDDVVALLRQALELVERVVEERAEIRIGAGQVVVERLLEPGARALDRRVADGMRRELVVRVDPQEDAPEVLPLLCAVPGEDRAAVGGVDRPALDGQLLDDQVGIATTRLEVGRLPEPPGGHADHGHE
jgi:hypothetical protein